MPKRPKVSAIATAAEWAASRAKAEPASRTETVVDHGARAEFRPGDIELRQHGIRKYRGARVAGHASDCLLDRYRSARTPLVTQRQYAAGMCLRELWDLASRLPRVTARLDATAPGQADELPRRILRAKQDVDWLLGVLLPVEMLVVEDVCRHDKPAAGRMNLLCRGLDWIGDALDLECTPAEEAERVLRRALLVGRRVRAGSVSDVGEQTVADLPKLSARFRA